MTNIFRFGDHKHAHKLGDKECGGCRWDEPTVCDKCGEGLIHIELSKHASGDVFLYYCDICAGMGKDWKKPKQKG